MSGAWWWRRASWLALQRRRWFSGPRVLGAEHVLSSARSLRVLAVPSVVICGWVSLFPHGGGWVVPIFLIAFPSHFPPWYFLISCWSRLLPAQSLTSEIAGHIHIWERKGPRFPPAPARGWAVQPEVFLNLPGTWVRSKAPGVANRTNRKLNLSSQAWMLWRTVHWRWKYILSRQGRNLEPEVWTQLLVGNSVYHWQNGTVPTSCEYCNDR